MIGGDVLMRVFRSVFREQKTRLQIDWLTNTDERIMEHLAEVERDEASAIATEIGRSAEYVSDRCRQLGLRGLLEEHDPGTGPDVTYSLAGLGERYLADEMDAEELEERAG